MQPSTNRSPINSRFVRGSVVAVVLALAAGLLFGGGAFAQLASVNYEASQEPVNEPTPPPPPGGCGYSCPPPPCGYYCPPPPGCYTGGYGGPVTSCPDPRPDARMGFAPSSPRAGTTVTFTSYGTVPYSATLAWDLDNDGAFDDGSTSSVEKVFDTAGRHTVRLQATDRHGRTAVTTQTVSVHAENIKPNAGLYISPDQPRTGATVTFHPAGGDIDGTVTKYELDYDGDGTYDAEGVPSNGYPYSPTASQFTHVFTAAGDYTTVLRVTDDFGATTLEKRVLHVHEGNVPPRISYFSAYPNLPRVGSGFSVTGSASDPDGTVAKAEIDYQGDGTFDASSANGSYFTFQHTYTAAGEFEMVVRLTDDAGATTESRRTVQVHEGNIAPRVSSVSINPQNPRVGTAVQFSAYGHDADGQVTKTDFDLDGDGTYETPQPQYGGAATKLYDVGGTYTIRVRVTDNDGATDFAVRSLTVSDAANVKPTADIIYDTPRPTLGQTDTLYAWNSQDPDGHIVEYAWDLDGDGAYDDLAGRTETSARMSFPTAGDYPVGLRVTDSEGATDTDRVTFRVTADGGNIPPIASGYASPGRPRVNATVNLNSSSHDPDGDGSPLTYEWDVDGDGVYDVSTASATTSFATPGEHDVSLRVTDSGGAEDVTTFTVPVSAGNAAPVASYISVDPARPTVGESVSLSSYASDQDGSVQSYAWDIDGDDDFDDGLGASSFVTTTFNTTGEKTVKFRATDNEGATDISTVTFLVATAVANVKPSASIGGSERVKPDTPLYLYANGYDPDGNIESYDWDTDGDGTFGDATTSSVNVTFAQAGTYHVRLKVTDDDGAVSTGTRTITVSAIDLPPTVSNISGSTRLKPGSQGSFYVSTFDPEGDQVTVTWDFGDGTPPQEGMSYLTQLHTFAEAGYYDVTVTATAGGKSTSLTHTVRVSDGNLDPTIGFSSYPSAAKAGDVVSFNATGFDPDNPSSWMGSAVTYTWDLDHDGAFDDGTGYYVSKQFTQPGKYVVGLKGTDSDGGFATVTRTIQVSSQLPTAAFTYTPEQPTTENTIQLTSSSTDPDGTIASQDWDLDGDGDFDDASGATASKAFAEPGEYMVALRVRDDADDVDVETKYIQVRCGDCPVAAFTWSPENPSSGDEITFTSTSSDPNGTIASTLWDLDHDGSFDDASGTTAKKTFNSPGHYEIGLKVVDNSGKTDTKWVQVFVGNRAPTGDFTFTPASPTSGEEVTFTGTGSDVDGTITGYAWDVDFDGFDDGSTATLKYTFQFAGNRTVRMRVTDNDGGQSIVTKQVTIVNRPPTASITRTPAAPLTNQTVTFNGASSSDLDGMITGYAWDLDNDGQYDDGTGSTATKSYATPGQQSVALRVTDNSGATNTITHEFTVGNRAPLPSFSVSPAFPDTGVDVTFTSTSTDPDGSNDALTFAWDLDDDGQFDDGTGATATRTFPTKAVYTIGLRVTDERGDTATKEMDVAVGNDAPTAAFTSSPADPLSGTQVTFTSTSTDPDGTIAQYAWDTDGDNVEDFNDGTAATTTRTFATPGSKLIRLKVTDNGGKSATTTSTIVIGNRGPSASFTVGSGDDFVEVNEAAQLTSNSTDPDGPVSGLTYAWDIDGDGFDDGTTKSIAPSWQEPGSKTVALKVTDAFGLSDTYERSIQVTAGNLAPYAYLYSDRYETRTGRPVTFYVSAYDQDGDGISLYEWDVNRDGDFDDAGDSEGASATSQAFTFTQTGEQTVRARVTDGKGETAVAETTVRVTSENRAPELYVYASRYRVRVGADVTFSAYGYDHDDGIASYQWDTDNDGTFDRQGATLSEITVPMTTAGTRTVRVKVVDSAPAPDTKESTVRTLDVTVVAENTPPSANLGHWPYNAERNKPVEFWAWAWDDDGDQITKYEWDFNDDGDYTDADETPYTGKTSAMHTFAAVGSYTVKLRVTDEGGASRVVEHAVQVTNSPPQAFIDASTVAPEIGETVKLTSASVDADGTIVKTEWDLDSDGDYDDGKADGTAELTRDVTGSVYARLRVVDNEGQEGVTYKAITFRNPTNVGVPEPAPVQLPNGTPMNIGTTVNPETGTATITIPNGEVSKFDPVTRCVPLEGEFRIKAGGGVISGAVLVVEYNGTKETLALEHLEGEMWKWRLKCAINAQLFVEYDLTEGEDSEHFRVPIGGIQLIDPQGVVYDEAAYNAAIAALGKAEADITEEDRTAARATAAITGATVILERFNSETNTWKKVLSGDPGISPNVNPQVTGANGLYQWDVAAGVYRVRVSAPGYDSVDSVAVTIPPPVLDLHIPMVKNSPPKAAFQASETQVGRNEEITLTSQSTDVGGSIVTTEWDLDDDGEFDDADGATIKHTFTTLGTKRVKMRVTDNSGDTGVAEKTFEVANAKPTAVITAPATARTLETVDFSVNAVDPDGTIAKVEWDLDEDAAGVFEVADATAPISFTTSRSFDRSDAERVVRVRVTDAEGAETVSTAKLVITNQAPTAILTVPATAKTLDDVLFSVVAQDVDGTIASYGWELDGDGDFNDDTDASATRHFAKSGTYPIKVRVTDDEGASVTESGQVTITNRAPTATLSVPVTAKTLEDVTFTVEGSDLDGTIAAYAWELDGDDDFNDDADASATRQFAKAGTYPIKVRVTDDEGASVTKAGEITVANRAPSLTVSGPASTPTGTEVTFTATAADADGTIAKVEWALDEDDQFNDTGTGSTIARSFSKSDASRLVKARVTDDEGAVTVAETAIVVTNRAPTAVLTNATTAKTLEDVQFSVAATDADGTIKSVEWEFSDSTDFNDGTGATLTRQFAKSGTYPVKARVTDDENATVVKTGSITITNRAPTAVLTVPATAKTLEDVAFTVAGADQDGSVASIAWELDNDGDFNDDTDATASRQFAKSGSYPIKVRVTDDEGGTITESKTITITNRAPTVTTLTVPATVKTLEDVTFSVVGADADGTVSAIAWDTDADGQFDDGTGGTVTKQFSKSGTKAIKVRLTDDEGATVVGTGSIQVTNRAPAQPVAITAPETANTGETVTLTANPSDPDGTIAKVEWALDEDEKFDDTGTGNTIAKVFAKSDASRLVKVRVTDDEGATATGEATLVIKNRAPVSAFKVDPAAPVADTEVTFTSEASDPDGTVAKVAWDLDGDSQFDDGTGVTVKRAFPAGVRTIRLRVTDDEGAETVGSKELTVATKPVVDPTPKPQPEPTPNPTDTTAPDGSGKAAAMKLAAALSRGVKITLSCNEACAADGSITIDAKTAKALGLGSRAIKIATGQASLAAGEGTVTLRFTSKAKKALKKKRKARKFKAVLKLADAAGNQRTITVTIRLKK